MAYLRTQQQKYIFKCETDTAFCNVYALVTKILQLQISEEMWQHLRDGTITILTTLANNKGKGLTLSTIMLSVNSASLKVLG